MKLTKQSLRQMIKEAADDVKLKQQGMSQARQAGELRKTAGDVATGAVGGEFDPIERSLVQQISDVITDIASAPDVDLGDFRAQLNTVMNRLKDITGAELGGEEEEEQLKEGATRFDPALSRREPQEGEIEIMKGRGDRQEWFYVSSAEDAMTLVTLGRNWGYPTGIIQNLSGEQVPQGYSIREER